MSSHSNDDDIIALRLLSCLKHPTKLHSLSWSCFPRSLIPILYLSTAWCSIDLLRVHGTFLSKDVPFILLPLTIFDCLSLYLFCLRHFLSSFALLWCSFTSSGCVTHQVCVNVIIRSQKYEIPHFFLTQSFAFRNVRLFIWKQICAVNLKFILNKLST